MKFLKIMSIPKLITVLSMIGLGVNGLVQVGLQKQMAAKAETLQLQIAQTEQLSGKMKDGLHGIEDLKKASAHMSGTLQSIEEATGDMNNGLATLDQTVSGINGSVKTIGSSTHDSAAVIQTAEQNSDALLAILQQIGQVNSQMIEQMNVMIQAQTAINNNLHQMNQKTAILPGSGGQ